MADPEAPARAVKAASNPDRITVHAASPEAIAAYGRFADTAICAPPQSAVWVAAWLAAVTRDGVILMVEENGRTVFAMALEIVARGPFRIVRLAGATHANGNFAPADPEWLARDPAEAIRRLPAALAAARPDIDALVLERLVQDHAGFRNPLLALGHSRSPNVALAVDLKGGFADLVSGPRGKRKRKKHRSQLRKYEAAGGFRRVEAGNVDEVDRLLDAFFEMKAVRFRKAGIANVFGEPDIQAFFRKLFRDALPFAPKPFVLHALEVGGRIRAVTGSSRTTGRLICDFSAIADDEMTQASPGDFLFFENIREACDQGLAVFDFSVGDEPYKRLWCDIETRQMDVTAPLTAKGRLLVAALRTTAALKARIKESPAIWRLVKSLRQLVGREATARTSGDP
jgi:CelD/BcsL family acetyltransferase involved in cellulose biosynthesis